ncbi:cysteine hydrolase family protein [Streptomyces sp. NPDC127117]|uniref:cysteine hydrolase family protein n=1 Tax=Streptomyces sp. NPDC127117 TaxID=3345368 RepID=UPI0036363D71
MGACTLSLPEHPNTASCQGDSANRKQIENRPLVHGDPSIEFHQAVAPEPGEVTVLKNRINAFAGNDLEQILAAGDVGHLVLAGIATGGVVLSTACLAADLDHRLTVLADGCADPGPELHRLLVEKVFARRGDVFTVDEWVKSLPGQRA